MADIIITARMVSNYLETEVPPDTQIALTSSQFKGVGDFIALDTVLEEIAMEPERYQDGI